jgi:type II secretory ATPase GspE/PulE/Tfp pilus assembly ATPase PilB-like protein
MNRTTAIHAHTTVEELARAWGWSGVQDFLRPVLDLALAARQTKSGELLAKLAQLDEEEVNRLLQGRPANAPILDWLATQRPSLRGYTDKILCLQRGFAYYDTLNGLAEHSIMLNTRALARAEEVQGVALLTDTATPVLVFASLSALLKYKGAGRDERQNDPMWEAVGRDALYAVTSPSEIGVLLNKLAQTDRQESSSDADATWQAGSASTEVQRIVVRILDAGMADNATDVSLVPRRNGELRVLMRKNNDLIPVQAMQVIRPEMAGPVIAFLLQKSGGNPTGTQVRDPRDGQISYRSAVGEAFLRLSFIPLNHPGDLFGLISVSIRILPRLEATIDLTSLNLRADVQDDIHFAIRQSKGLVLVAGATNSGKSTTIAGAMGAHIYQFGGSKKRLSVEHPVERFLHGITQINVPSLGKKEREDEYFVDILRAIKRHDPDVIWVGEIRDEQTANLCAEAAASGHLVLSTIHANDTIVALNEVLNKIQPDRRLQLIESLSLIVGQKLVKRVCPHCRNVGAPSEQDHKDFERLRTMLGEEVTLPPKVARAHQPGCPKCSNGYTGLMPVNESLPFSRAVKDAAAVLATGQLTGGYNPRQVMADARTVTYLRAALEAVAALDVELDSILD